MYRKKHNLYGGAGFSYAHGEDDYYEAVWQQPGSFDALVYHTGFQETNFYGGYILAGYNYALIKSRVNIGLHTKFRMYSGNFWQHDINLNLGYNFSLPKRKAG